MIWSKEAPANIALIKYMGKTSKTANTPTNISFSYTLDKLLSRVSCEGIDGEQDQWQPLDAPGWSAPRLSAHGTLRFLKHFSYIKQQFGVRQAFRIRSANNFPADCGLASSASSFAALTDCAILACSDLTKQPLPTLGERAQLSRLGSGSSCRSFFRPFAIWQEETCEAYHSTPYDSLRHRVIIIENQQKTVSSSQAHQRVLTSLLFANRPARAQTRLTGLLAAFVKQDWRQAYEICWQEFWDMHGLFFTSQPPFHYLTANSLSVLLTLQRYWEIHGDGPLITMDAGANIHCLFRPDQKKLELMLLAQFGSTFDVL